MLFCQRPGLAELVQLLRRQTGLRHRVTSLGEAVVEAPVVADADGVRDFVPIVIGVQAVGGRGLLGVAELPAAAGEGEALPVVGQMPLPYLINGLEIHHHGNVHVDVQLVCPVLKLPAYLLPLPAIPVRDVGKLRLPFRRRKVADGGQFPVLAAMAAGQAGAFARQLPLRAAMGTFIQNTLQTVRPETVGDLNAVFPLPAELVEREGFVQSVGQLLDGFLLQILDRKSVV